MAWTKTNLTSLNKSVFDDMISLNVNVNSCFEIRSGVINMENLDGLYNDLICLCEIRGELSPEDNAKVEARISELRKQIAKIEETLN